MEIWPIRDHDMIIHPFTAIDFEMIDFWLKKILLPTPYKRADNYHNAIHKELIRPRYGEGGPLPILTVLSGGEQAGKSTLGAAHMLAMHWCSKILWIVGERYDDTRLEFQYLTRNAVAIGIMRGDAVSAPANGPSRATFNNGCVVRTLSSEDESTLASESPDGVLMVEAGRQTYQAFRTLWTRVTHNTGWLLVSGTFEQFKGRWFPDLWNICQGDNEFQGRSLCLPTYANPEKYPDGPRDPKILAIKKTLSDEEFDERFLGTPRSPLGVVFPEFRRSTHVKTYADYTPLYPINIWVDPGYYPSSYSVLLTQNVGGQTRLFYEYYTNTKLPSYLNINPDSRLPSMVNEDIAKYVAGNSLVEEFKKIVIDIAAEAHAGAGEPAAEAWRREFGPRNIPVVGRYVKIEEGLQRTHDRLRINPLTGAPYLIIHPSCENTIWELEEGYRFALRKGGEFGSVNKPIDKNNHSAKAIAYGIIDEFGKADGAPPESRPPAHRRMSYDRMVI